MVALILSEQVAVLLSHIGSMAEGSLVLSNESYITFLR